MASIITSLGSDPLYHEKKDIPSITIEALPTPPITPPELAQAVPKHSTPYFDQIEETATQDVPKPTVAVIGTGYVGLHLVEAFSTAYDVIAFDISQKRVEEIQPTVADNVTCTSDPNQLSKATHFLISVSTILNPHQRSIDVSCIEKAIETVAKQAHPGSTIVIESSVSVGMTRELLAPLMKTKAFLCGMSPERVDPGRTYPRYDVIPKVISGIDSASLSSIQELYQPVFQNLVPVSKPEVAEMTKLYENCQRMMCIAYANEMADACQTLSATLSESKTNQSGAVIDIDPWEVARAAATKPFGYMACTPSLGVGGHCIPVNPFYLLTNSEFPLLEACTKRMAERPARIGDRVMAHLTSKSKGRQCILIVGLGFKRGQSVLSHSPGKALAVHLLSNFNVHVEFADPLVEQSAVPFIPRLDVEFWHAEELKKFDAILVSVDQPGLDYSLLDDLKAQGTHVEWYCQR